MMSTVARPRQSACPFGHEFTPGNSRIDAHGCQRCLTCARRHARQFRIRQQARRENQRATWVLVTWHLDAHRDLCARFTYHVSRAAAAACAPAWQPFSIVDAARANVEPYGPLSHYAVVVEAPLPRYDGRKRKFTGI
jgi:hypothetical protein